MKFKFVNIIPQNNSNKILYPVKKDLVQESHTNFMSKSFIAKHNIIMNQQKATLFQQDKTTTNILCHQNSVNMPKNHTCESSNKYSYNKLPIKKLSKNSTLNSTSNQNCRNALTSNKQTKTESHSQIKNCEDEKIKLGNIQHKCKRQHSLKQIKDFLKQNKNVVRSSNSLPLKSKYVLSENQHDQIVLNESKTSNQLPTTSHQTNQVCQTQKPFIEFNLKQNQNLVQLTNKLNSNQFFEKAENYSKRLTLSDDKLLECLQNKSAVKNLYKNDKLSSLKHNTRSMSVDTNFVQEKKSLRPKIQLG